MFARVQLAALIAAASVYLVNAIPLFPRATCSRAYLVSAGDTCNGISAAQNVSTFQLASVNKAVIDPACDNLFVGEPLCLGLTGQDCTQVHVVAPSDTCASIIASANITLATLGLNNPNVNVDAGCTNIISGEVLCIASTPVYP